MFACVLLVAQESMLSLVLSSGAFAAGKEITGSIRLEVSAKPVDISKFELVLASEYWAKFTGMIFKHNRGTTLKGGKVDVIPGNGSYGQGVHEIPFVVPVPANLVASCEEVFGDKRMGAKHALTIKAVTKGAFSGNLLGNFPVMITDNETPIVLHHKESKNIYACCCFGKKGSVEVLLDCANLRFDRSKQRAMEFAIRVDNKTPLAVQKVRAEVHVGGRVIHNDEVSNFDQMLVFGEAMLDKDGCALLQIPMPGVAWRNIFVFNEFASDAAVHFTVHLSDGNTIEANYLIEII